MRPPDGDHFVMSLSLVIQVDDSRMLEISLRETVAVLKHWKTYVA